MMPEKSFAPPPALTNMLKSCAASAPIGVLAPEACEDVGAVREKFWSDGTLTTKPWSEEAAKSPAAQKFRDYFEYSEPLEDMPSHRVLAVLRGEKEEALSLNFDGGDETLYQAMIAQSLGVDMSAGGAATPWLTATVGWAWRTKLMFSAAVDARIRLRQRADAAWAAAGDLPRWNETARIVAGACLRDRASARKVARGFRETPMQDQRAGEPD